MEDQTHGTSGNGGVAPFTLRDLLAIGFRHRLLVVRTFLVISSAVFLLVLLRPAQYEAQMKILVKRERVDPVVTSEESSQRQAFWQGITEEELNSEVELLKSRDLLAKVVVATRLHDGDTGIGARLRELLPRRVANGLSEKDLKIAQAVEKVEEKLNVQPLRKSGLIEVSYESRDPVLSAAVLKTLADGYLEKHLAVHRPPGAFDFFEQEAERYRNQLAVFEVRLAQQKRDDGVFSAPLEKEIALRELANLEATEQATRVQIAETAQRVRALGVEAGATPVRTTTEIRTGSAGLIEQLQSTLVALEQRRIGLLTVFRPSYRPVREVDTQIAKLKEEIAAAQQSPLHEETTDRDPTYAYLQTELAKNRAELAALQARAGALAASVSTYREKARRLERVELVQQDLAREAKQAEQNYLIHFRKREEARVSNALDVQRIVNVAVAEEPTVPFEPSGPRRSLLILLGGLLAGLVSGGLAFAVDYWAPSFRTPDEIQAALGCPVLAAIPRNGR